MSGLEHYLSIFTKAVFIENIVLAYFLGLCSFLAISKNINASVGIGMAVVLQLQSIGFYGSSYLIKVL